MLKQNWRLINRFERIGDTLLIIAAFLLAYYGRDILLLIDQQIGANFPFSRDGLAPIKDYFIVLLLGLIGYHVCLSALGAYNSMRLSSVGRLFWMSLLSSFLVFIFLAASLFILKVDLARSFVGTFCVLVAIFLGLERFVVLRFLRFWRRRGRNFRNVIICGIGNQAVKLAKEIYLRPELGIHIRGFADLRVEEIRQMAVGSDLRQRLQRNARIGRIIHGRDALTKALREYAIDEVIFTDVVENMSEVEEMVLICSEQGVRTTIAADLFSIGMVKSGLSYFGGMPLIHFQTPPGDSWELVVKRAIDICVSAALLIVLSPLFVMLAIGVKTTPGPIIFKQRRVGLNGRIFHMFKFRSMYANADSQLSALRPYNEMRGPVFKMRNDPRVTPFGRILRRFSLDELPQLWNVLIGNMSLVGPRPPVPGEVSLYERRSRRRLSMRPGITCTWQVSGRNEIKDFDSWVKLDLDYIDNWSLTNDLILLARTIPAVFFGTGAR